MGRRANIVSLASNRMKGTAVSLAIERVRSTDVSKRFGFYYDEAMTHPIAVERNGAARVVMMPASEYERLSRLDHIALAPEELSDEAFQALRTAEAPAEAYELNKLMDGAA
jgi:PHD/YefM family antitoxin component YafN of YafNO toxin-antitoxin module